jgi:hypothetical protein
MTINFFLFLKLLRESPVTVFWREEKKKKRMFSVDGIMGLSL